MRRRHPGDFLEAGTLGAIGLTLADFLALKAQAAAVGNDSPQHDERAVIMIFNLGAPSQLDCFDLKPEAPAEIRGPFQPIKTKAPGLEISEIFPRHAEHADKFSLVRSCFHTAAAVHDTGHQMMQTGRLFTGGINTPHAGCALAYCAAARPTCRHTSSCPSRWARPAADCRTARTRAFWARPTTRSS